MIPSLIYSLSTAIITTDDWREWCASLSSLDIQNRAVGSLSLVSQKIKPKIIITIVFVGCSGDTFWKTRCHLFSCVTVTLSTLECDALQHRICVTFLHCTFSLCYCVKSVQIKAEGVMRCVLGSETMKSLKEPTSETNLTNRGKSVSML